MFRACLHEGRGPQVGEVTCLGGVARLSIQSLILMWSRLRVRWGNPPQVTSPTSQCGFCNDNNTSETYMGLTENAFETRYRNHTASFRHTKHRNSTELSKHVWSLKDNNIDYSISWRIISSSSSYNSSSKRCNLCLKEKFLIICRPDLSSLNKRNELVSSCRHRNKALLRNN